MKKPKDFVAKIRQNGGDFGQFWLTLETFWLVFHGGSRVVTVEEWWWGGEVIVKWSAKVFQILTISHSPPQGPYSGVFCLHALAGFSLYTLYILSALSLVRRSLRSLVTLIGNS